MVLHCFKVPFWYDINSFSTANFGPMPKISDLYAPAYEEHTGTWSVCMMFAPSIDSHETYNAVL
jgi:hypothetical protein